MRLRFIPVLLQGLQLATGARDTYNPVQTLVKTSIGIATGGIAGKFNSYSFGITSGILTGLNYGKANGSGCTPKCY